MIHAAIPQTLKDVPQWICWRYCPDPSNPNKPTKKPVNAHTGNVCNAHAQANWADFQTALQRFENGGVDGVGFVLTVDDPFVGVDLDGCIHDDGGMAPWAADVVGKLNSYTEISPSGRGLRVFVRGTLPPGGRRRGPIEMYDNLRFLTVTGNHLSGTPATIENRQDQLLTVHRQIFGTAADSTPTAPRPVEPLTMDDDKLLEIAFKSKHGQEIHALWNGHVPFTGSDGKPDESAADMSLSNHLIYWTQGDLPRADRLFRLSGLMRPKWDEPRGQSTYGQNTLEKALKTIPYFYDPTYRSNGHNGTGHHMQTAEPEEIHTSPVEVVSPPADMPPSSILVDAVNEASATVRGLDTLLAELASVPDGAEVKRFALAAVPSLAKLGRADQAQFYTHLQERAGITGEWVRLDLKPAVKEAARAAARSDTDEDGAGFNGATWIDYVNAAAELGYSFRLNDLNDGLEVNDQRMTDATEAVILSKLHARNLKSADVAKRAFLAAAVADRYHPVKAYLEKLEWDGADHIGALAIHFLDTHTPITYENGSQRSVFHAFLLRWLVGAVAKVYDSSRAQNPMLILDGAQGRGKSFFAKWICPLPDMHIEGAIRPDDKDYLSYLTTRWVWEVSELGATMRKADREALKAFITLQDATFRPAYGRHALVKPALASFIGTVNLDGALLNDPTGHRRFWPVSLETIDWGYSQVVDVNQLWAQAYALYLAGEPWQLTNEERRAHAEIVDLYEVEDILAGYVQEYFLIDTENETLFTQTTDIVTTLRDPKGADLKGSERALSMQLASTLKRLGLVRERRFDNYGARRWGYRGIQRRRPATN